MGDYKLFIYLIDTILPFFGIGALGFLLGRLGSFDVYTAMAINKFVMHVAVPALIIKFMSAISIYEINFSLLRCYLVAEVIIYVGSILVARLVFRRDLAEAVLIGATIAMTNHLLFVLPIGEQIYGETSVLPIVSIITMDGLILFTATLVTMDILTSEDSEWQKTVKKICKNPPIVATFIGVIVSSAEIYIPEGIDLFLGSLGNSASPALLFSLGVMLSICNSRNRNPLVWILVILKLLIHPLLVYFLLCVARDVKPNELGPAMLVAAAPCRIMGFMFALNYKVDTKTISSAILYTSIGSLVTLTFAANI